MKAQKNKKTGKLTLKVKPKTPEDKKMSKEHLKDRIKFNKEHMKDHEEAMEDAKDALKSDKYIT